MKKRLSLNRMMGNILMTNLQRLSVLALAIVGTDVIASDNGDAPARPNIVVYMIDDLGWNQTSAGQGTMETHSGVFQTPHLEQLANEGLSFNQAYMQPNCAPSRAAILSGQYPARVNNDVYVVGNLNRNQAPGITKAQAQFKGPQQSEDVAAEAVTIAEALKQNGYATAHIGKYHVGGHDGEATLPENQGFDINIGGYHQGHQPVCFAKKVKDEWHFPGLGRGDFDRFAQPYTKAYVEQFDIPPGQIGQPKHVCDALADAMEETVGKLNAQGEPFYLQLHAYAVHGPVKARPDLKAAALQRLDVAQKKKAELAGFVAGMDHTLGRLIAALNDPNGDGDTSDSIANNTLILFTSDNGGTHFNNRPLRGIKGMFTEGGIRVPLIVCWPGVIPANTVTDHLVHGVDFYPTLVELAGNQWLPAELAHPLDGESFAATLRQPSTQENRDPIFYLFPGYMDSRAQPCVVAIDESAGKRYKLLYFYEADAWELYNLSDDIGEQRNLIQNKPELAGELSKKIRAWLTQQHPTWKPKYPLNKQSGQSVGPPALLR
jgi:arylsulfatase A-like enzyme